MNRKRFLTTLLDKTNIQVQKYTYADLGAYQINVEPFENKFYYWMNDEYANIEDFNNRFEIMNPGNAGYIVIDTPGELYIESCAEDGKSIILIKDKKYIAKIIDDATCPFEIKPFLGEVSEPNNLREQE